MMNRNAEASRSRAPAWRYLAGAVLAASTILVAPAPAHAATQVMRSVEIRGFKDMCLDVRGPNTADGTGVQMWGCMNVPQQRWTIWNDGTIRTDLAPSKCLTSDAPWANGVQLVIRTCNLADNGQWFAVSNLPTSPGSVGGRIQHIQGKCIDVSFPDSSYGTPVQLWDCAGVDNQLFTTVKTQFVTPGSNRLFFHQRWQAATVDRAMCFSLSSCARRDHLLAVKAEVLGGRSTLSHSQVGDVLLRLAAKSSQLYATTEKVWIWNSIVADVQAGRLTVTSTGSQPSVRNSWLNPFGPADATTWKHTVVAFTDGYHGPLTDFTLQAAFSGPVAPYEDIWYHEKHPQSILGQRPEIPDRLVNRGDVEASTRQVISLQRFQASNSFADFALYWNGLMREVGNWCPVDRIFESGCTAATFSVPRLR